MKGNLFKLIILNILIYFIKCENNKILTKEELIKLPLKTLKGMLEERDINCLGCNEKLHYVEKVEEVQHLLPVIKDKKKDKSYNNNENNNNNENKKNEKVKTPQDKENIEEVLEQLKKSGFGNAKVFTADDMKNFKPEDFSSSGNSNSKNKRQRKKSSKSDL